jgi:hypothetical protein
MVKVAPWPSSLSRSSAPPCASDETPRQPEAETHAGLHAHAAAAAVFLEDAGVLRRCDADSVIAHGDDRLL